MDTIGIKELLNSLWNSEKHTFHIFVYKRVYVDIREFYTLLRCVCANVTWIPPMIIFKVKLSPKGWINSDLFYICFQFFVNAVPLARPVILLFDSHASHIDPEENCIFLFTFPVDIIHLLQPLDVGVYRSLKSHWAQRLNSYMNFCSNNNITNAFKKTGIRSFNNCAIPKEVLQPSQLTHNPLPEEVLENHHL
ncbi:hypothetical protein PR048_012797 [Dryococelus australis]|uniref:DDE-1 domain-containing protein n=1 Tax=Dryococelus australis TaxID=614101 RepID=A0ABQ9HR14_9NEOP|nr:hypothetical protein PR048_012797 [Dryococelus australis]